MAEEPALRQVGMRLSPTAASNPAVVDMVLICVMTFQWVYGPRSRKNCARLVAGRVTDLVVPSLVMLVVLGTQLAAVIGVPACSNIKLAVLVDGQETVIPPCGMLERRTESVGRGNR